RGLSWYHRRGECRTGETDRGGIAAAPGGIARSADGGGDHSWFLRGWWAHRRGASRHTGADYRKGQRGYRQSRRRSRREKETSGHRQLYAPHDCRQDRSLCRQAAGNLAAGAADDLDAIKEPRVYAGATSKPSKRPRVMARCTRPVVLASAAKSDRHDSNPALPFATAMPTRLTP